MNDSFEYKLYVMLNENSGEEEIVKEQIVKYLMVQVRTLTIKMKNCDNLKDRLDLYIEVCLLERSILNIKKVLLNFKEG